MLTPNLSIGGAERWVATLIRHSNPRELQWTGVALSGWGGIEPALCHEIVDVAGVPIFAEKLIDKTSKKQKPTPAAVSPDCERWLTRTANIVEAVERASVGADVLVAWGDYKYRRFIKGPDTPNKFVLVSHSSHHKTHEIPPVDYCETFLTAVSDRAKKPYLYNGNAPVEVIYNGVDLDRLVPRKSRQAMRVEWNAGSRYVIGYVGRHTLEKNPGAAISAMEYLDDKHWMAVYYGNYPTGHRPAKDSLLTHYKENPVPHIQFYEPIMEVGDIYAGIDVLMLASHSEAFALTLLEGWLTETPVIATPVGSVPELQERFGELVIEVPMKPTATQLADACTKAVSPAGAAIVARAHEVAMEHFTAEKMASNWARYLSKITRPDKRVRLTEVLDL